jgi:electron transfer flavoprotein alpha subunit
MSILVYAEFVDGKPKKSTFEAVYYAAQLAQQLQTKAVALTIGPADGADLAALGQYGVAQVLHAGEDRLAQFQSKAYTKVIAAAAQAVQADVVVLTHNANGKALAGRVAVRLEAGLVSGAIALPQTEAGFSLRKPVFSGKAFAQINIQTGPKVISVNPNSLKPEAGSGSATVETLPVSLADSDFDARLVKRETMSGDVVPLPEAELVVSAGRGMKGPEHWGIIEELAATLGATTACSRPVADTGWRPHHEHVGQTGVAIKPNLYIAIGISGAIQHLAGVNQSKTIVVINKDAEAPFFKAADYGVIGDAFEVVPKLTQALKSFKNS